MSGFREVVSRLHEDLKRAMMPHQGQELMTAEIRRIIESGPEFQGNEQWIQPSDHCINHINIGACYCAETERAIFERVRRGLYRVRNVA